MSDDYTGWTEGVLPSGKVDLVKRMRDLCLEAADVIEELELALRFSRSATEGARSAEQPGVQRPFQCCGADECRMFGCQANRG